MIQVRLLKRGRREVKVDPKFGAQWKEKEKFPFLGGQWNVPLLGSQWNVEEKPFSPLPALPPTNILKPSIFPLTLKFYFTMVLGHYSRLSFLFLDL
jgi:hypothetical protein